ncbi:MAG: SAM-dependent methyltransferase [Deltaproteobacteria bacterium]|nr:SAM-dependent methyltransferase [Deltaproteobacteria bacterium]
MPALSARLADVAALCPEGAVVADIGSDHGLLPLALLRMGRAPRVIAVDLHPGPVAQLRVRAAAEPRLEVRAGDGLAPLRPGEAQIIVLAGIGARLAERILRAAPDVWAAAARVIVQVNEGPEELRAALLGMGMELVDQRFVEERGRPFFTDALRPRAEGPAPPLSGAAALLGPRLLAAPPPALRGWVRREMARLDVILAGLALAPPPGLVERRAALVAAETSWGPA